MKTTSTTWIEKFGEFLLDIGKYVLTAIAFGTFMSDKADIWQWFVAVIVFAFMLVATGLMFIHIAHRAKEESQTTEIKKATFHIEHADIRNDHVG